MRSAPLDSCVTGLGQVHVVVVERLAVDAVARAGRSRPRSCPARGPAASATARRSCPRRSAATRRLRRRHSSAVSRSPVRGGLDRGERADLAVERDVRQLQPLRQAGLCQDPVPPLDAALAVGDVLPAQVGVEPGQRGTPRSARCSLASPASTSASTMIESLVSWWSSWRRSSSQRPLRPGGVVVGDVRRGLAAEQVERHRVVEVQVLLDHRQRDRAVGGHVVGVVLAPSPARCAPRPGRRRWCRPSCGAPLP